MRASEWIGEEERKRVASAIGEAEKKTSAEIVVAVATASDDYPHVGFFVMLAATLAGVAGVSFLPAGSYHWWHPTVAAFGGLLIGTLAARMLPDALRRLLATEPRLEEEVRQRAIELFYVHHLTRTARRTGVLLYVSLLERRVLVWADEAVAAKFPAESWEDLVGRLADGMGGGAAGDALSAAVAEMGERLAKEFPPVPGDVDEIPNEVVVLD